MNCVGVHKACTSNDTVLEEYCVTWCNS